MAEVVELVRRASLPGVQMIQARQTPREWGHLNGAYGFGSMWDWRGRLQYRRRQLPLSAGDTFLCEPGEFFHAAPFEGRAGTFRVFEIAPSVFEAACRAEGHQGVIHFARIATKATPLLASALDALDRALVSEAEPLEQQSALARLVSAAMSSVLEQAASSLTRPVPLGPCERLRELLHSSDGARVNLAEFALQANVSQFQLLRAFKRRYGAPPHAYGLHVRVERARRLLRSGFSVAEAAAATDFTDQSHLTRHFRRVLGLTPGQYAVGSRLSAFAPAERSRR